MDYNSTGGVTDPTLVSCFPKEQVVRMEETPARFLVSCKRTSGVHGKTYKGRLHKPFFFSIITTIVLRVK